MIIHMRKLNVIMLRTCDFSQHILLGFFLNNENVLYFK